MADELTLTLKVSYSKNGVTLAPADVSNKKITISGNAAKHFVQNIGTTEEAIDLGDVTTGGWWFAWNRDSTNWVEIRVGTGGADFVRLEAGEFFAGRLSPDNAAPYAIADTAACNVEFLIIDD